MNEYYVILGQNSYNAVCTFGTLTGQPFRSYDSAERNMRKLEKRHPDLSLIVLDITPMTAIEAIQ